MRQLLCPAVRSRCKLYIRRPGDSSAVVPTSIASAPKCVLVNFLAINLALKPRAAATKSPFFTETTQQSFDPPPPYDPMVNRATPPADFTKDLANYSYALQPAPYPVVFTLDHRSKPSTVFLVSVPSVALSTRHPQTSKYIAHSLEPHMRNTRNLIHRLLYNTYKASAVLHRKHSPDVLVRHCLLPHTLVGAAIGPIEEWKRAGYAPQTLPSERQFPISSGHELHLSLAQLSNEGTDTWVVLAHRGCECLGWIGWAREMQGLTPTSAFGVAFRYILLFFFFFFFLHF